MGALFGGGPGEVLITFSHERLFLPTTPALPPIDMARHLGRLRAMMRAGRYQEAADLAVSLAEERGYGGLRWTDPFVPAFDLRVSGPVHGQPSGYLRGTDFETGEVGATWQDERGDWWHRLFVSRADDVAVLRLVGPGRGSVDGAVGIFAPPGPPGSNDAGGEYLSVLAECQRQHLDGVAGFRAIFRRAHDRSVVGYQVALRVVAHGGRTVRGPEGFTVAGADEVVAIIGLEVLTEGTGTGGGAGTGGGGAGSGTGTGAGTTFPPMAARLNALENDYAGLLARHAAIHGGLFRRAHLDLGGQAMSTAAPGAPANASTPETGSAPETVSVPGTVLVPSEELLERARSGVAPAAVVEKVFDAGRYAIISSCGALPPNLQGVWTGTYAPPWSGDYTHNGNLQTALAALLSTGTPELLLGYFSYLESMLADFRENSRSLFGCRGCYVPSRFSTHGLQNHFNETWCHEFWTAGGGWAARLFYDYWQYTGDEDFLVQRALPFMVEVADFYEDFLVEDATGSLVFVPSVSPENNPGNSASQATINATMDIAVVKDLFRNLVSLSKALGTHVERALRWEALLRRLPAYTVDGDDALAEWIYPALHSNQAHRHASHLYPLLYEVDPEIACDKAMLRACRRAVELRMRWRRQPGNGEMAFGLAWLGIVAAHLGMADVALETVNMLAARYWRPSLVSSHDALGGAGGGEGLFNVDICGGLPALIVEMLVQSSVGTVRLLPACPAEWESGRIEGIACRGQVLVERLSWGPGRVAAVLRSPKETSLTLVLPATSRVVRVDGQLVSPGGGGNTRRVESAGGSDQRVLLRLAAMTATTVETWLEGGEPRVAEG
jgi:hypothetical protein